MLHIDINMYIGYSQFYELVQEMRNIANALELRFFLALIHRNNDF